MPSVSARSSLLLTNASDIYTFITAHFLTYTHLFNFFCEWWYCDLQNIKKRRKRKALDVLQYLILKKQVPHSAPINHTHQNTHILYFLEFIIQPLQPTTTDYLTCPLPFGLRSFLAPSLESRKKKKTKNKNKSTVRVPKTGTIQNLNS